MIKKRSQIKTICVQSDYLTRTDCAEKRLLRLLSFFAVSILVLLSACSPEPAELASEELLFLAWDDSGVEQLYQYNFDKEPEQLTRFAAGVQGFAPSPDGRHIALSVMGDDGSSEIWMMGRDGSAANRLHSCPMAECSNLAWAPDSRRLLFERREKAGDGAARTPVLWWLDTDTSSVLPVLEDEGQHGTFGSLSPDGQWLSYHSPEQEGLLVYNLEDGRSQFVTNEIGTKAAWRSDSRYLLLPLLDLVIIHGGEGDDHQDHEHDYQTAVHLMRLDVNTGEQLMLSGDLTVEDSAPAWSPDGERIAFGRRAPGTGAARQLWIVGADGAEARAVTDDSAINHGPPAWSADGRYLLFQQIPQDGTAANPSIWRLDVQTGEKQQLVPSGMQPAWLPPAT